MTDLNSPIERAKLEDLTIGVNGEPAAHESDAVIRMHRAGWSGSQMAQVLGMRDASLVNQYRRDLDGETEAAKLGLPIHGAKASPAEFVRAKFIVVGDEFVEHGSSVVSIRRSITDFVFVLDGGKEVWSRGLEEHLVRRASNLTTSGE
ncbi:hypothetical protein JF714_15600 [Mycobacterium avium]|uniref:hypothetical protein n=1 Tax=Mycobacterium avium TaxID=1764 RepID=UPI001CDB11C5|nr:hypothetical protein [Mycobacterium avium]MCA2331867.1 hypothetical protein [Mycobacterium avium]